MPRPSPSPHAKAGTLPDQKRKGRDGRMWRSVPDKNGVFRWKHLASCAPPKKVVPTSPRCPSRAARCPSPMLYSEIRPREAQEDPTGQLSRYVGYLYSEKFDGWRGMWCNGRLQTKSGKLVFTLPPQWQGLLPPGVVLDGEVFLKGLPATDVARLRKPDSPLWRRATYHVFDMPSHKGPFAERVKAYTALVTRLCKARASCPLRAVKQSKVTSPAQLLKTYRAILAKGGEGVVITDPQSPYAQKRVGRDVRVKLKGRMDKEATVLGYNLNAAGVLGSLQVRHRKGASFRLGIGFTAADKREYKTRFPLRTTVTYSYERELASGKPRHARFVAVRHRGQ